MVWLSFKASRSAHHRHTPILAISKADHGRTWDRWMLDVVMNISRHKEVQPSIAVIIAKTCSCGPVTECDACLFGNVSKGAVVVVVKEAVLSKVGHIKIWPAIVVIIAYGTTVPPAVVGHACLCRNIGERPVMIVVKERCMRRLRLAIQRLIGGPVYQINVKPSIMVVIQQAGPGASGLKNEGLLRGAHFVVPHRQPGLF